MKSIYDCPRFSTCSANICPLYDEDYRKRSWFVIEEICPMKEVKEHPVIIAQRWLKKRYEKGQKTVKVIDAVKPLMEETAFYGGELEKLGKHLLRKKQYTAPQ